MAHSFRIHDSCEPEPMPTTGDCVGRWVLGKRLGEGSMSVVFLGTEEATGREAAVKFLKIQEQQGTARELEQFRQRFEREARLLSAIRHPHLVEIYEAALDGAHPYYAMERLKGKSLRTRFRMQPALSYAEVCRIGRETAEALAYAWEAGRIVHRDLKPGNMMLIGPDETVKVIDLGIAKAVGGELQGGKVTTMIGTAVGTPLYMSPEQHLGYGDIDFRADMYALGIILYELLTFEYPFELGSLLALLDAKERGVDSRWRRLASGMPDELVATVNRLMEPRREKRYGSYGELLEALSVAESVASTQRRRRPVTGEVTDGGTMVMDCSDDETVTE